MVSAPGERDQLTPVNHYTTGGKLWEMDFGLILGHIWTTQIYNSDLRESRLAPQKSGHAFLRTTVLW